MEQARESLDAWSNFGAFADRQRPDPPNVLTFWEWELQRQHWDLFFTSQSQTAKNSPRLFWERIAACPRLKRLCDQTARRDALHCHAVVFVLQNFHRREHGLWEARRDVGAEPTRKQQQRQWKAVLTKLTAISGEQWDLLGVNRSQLRLIMSNAEQFTKNPPIPEFRLRFLLTGVKGKKVSDIVGPAIRFPDPPKKGHHHDPESHESRLNLEISVLSEFLRPMLKATAQSGSSLPLWSILLSLLQHFDQKDFPKQEEAQSRGIDRLKKRVTRATDLDSEPLQRCQESYLSEAQTLLRDS